MATPEAVAASPSTRSRSSSPDDDELSMVKSRSRRANAGTRMSRLLAEEIEERHEEEEDPLQAWQDFEDDEEFGGEEAEDKGDVSLESSSDDDEDAEQGDEEQGERELQKQERQERSKKRKTRDSLLKRPGPNKRPNLVGAPSTKSTSDSPAPRPRKKSERVSWLPTQEDGPVRQSSRTLALQNKADTHERLKKKEQNRLRTVAIMHAAEQRKESVHRKAMTQEEKLAEAAEVERKNRKTLNRWKEAEKKRLEAQAAKLEALKNRKLDGPFIQYWSGPSIWLDDKLKHVGKGATIEEVEEQYAPKAKHNKDKDTASERFQAPSDQSQPIDSPFQTQSTSSQAQTSQVSSEQTAPSATTAPPVQPPTVENGHIGGTNIMFAPPAGPAGFLDGIHYWATLPEDAPLQPPQAADTSTNISTQPPPSQTDHPPLPPPARKKASLAARTLISLQNFTSETLKAREKDKEKDALLRILLAWPKNASSTPLPPPPHAPGSKKSSRDPNKYRTLCAITNLPARYRDPATGLPYHDSYAYKCIRRLVNGTCQWSSLVGAYVGPVYESPIGRPAVGVPERFWAKVGVPKEVVKKEGGETGEVAAAAAVAGTAEGSLAAPS